MMELNFGSLEDIRYILNYLCIYFINDFKEEYLIIHGHTSIGNYWLYGVSPDWFDRGFLNQLYSIFKEEIT